MTLRLSRALIFAQCASVWGLSCVSVFNVLSGNKGDRVCASENGFCFRKNDNGSSRSRVKGRGCVIKLTSALNIHM